MLVIHLHFEVGRTVFFFFCFIITIFTPDPRLDALLHLLNRTEKKKDVNLTLCNLICTCALYSHFDSLAIVFLLFVWPLRLKWRITSTLRWIREERIVLNWQRSGMKCITSTDWIVDGEKTHQNESLIYRILRSIDSTITFIFNCNQCFHSNLF